MKLWWYASLALLCSNVLLWHALLFSPGAASADIRFLPVGQGDAALITYGRLRVLVDAGPRALTAALVREHLPFFDRHIDLLILTHADTDHIGGAEVVLEKFPVRAIVYNGMPEEELAWLDLRAVAEKKGVPVIAFSRGDRIVYEGAVLEGLWPRKEHTASIGREMALEDNDASLVFAFEAEGVRALFTGDIGFAAENELIAAGFERADVLKVSHHGSPNASGLYFVEAVRPSISVVSVGENRYGHPAPRVMTRLAQAGSSVYRTDTDGEVRLRITDGFVEVLSDSKNGR